MSAQSLMVPRTAGSLWATRQNVAQSLSRMTGSSRRRSPYLRTSPTRVLALRLQRKHPQQKQFYGHMYRAMARQINERLPVMTFQRLLRQQDLRDENGLSEILKESSEAVWKDRPSSLATTGWRESDLDHWVWILSGDTVDDRVRRFTSSNAPKPLFVLMTILQSGQAFRGPDTLRLLLDYVNKNYCVTRATQPSANKWDADKHSRLTLSVSKFLIILRRLVRHVQQTWPTSIVTLAELTRNYIRSIPMNEKRNEYHKRCKVFNAALTLFSRPASVQPVKNMDFNWRAQRILLSMSDALDRPLVIEKLSYRAIRKVMVAQKKSSAETQVAMRYAKSWPPYRQDFDGHDAKRTPQDDQSRSVKAGVLMTEAGYEEDEYDRSLGALGGTLSRSPTIQTRSLPPREWTNDKEQDNFYTVWAMKVRSTRNAQEAWTAFNTFTDIDPTVQVYAEMFMKLQARRINPSWESLPGDAREVFPVSHGNYSEYELARSTPPTSSELYQHMLARGIKPEGLLLQNLVSNAHSIEEALCYLQDAGINAQSISHLAMYKANNYSILRRVPLLVLKSYIQLLCRLQPDRRGRQRLDNEELYRIHQAIRLAKIRLGPDTPEGASFTPVWHTICRGLARPYVALVNGEPIDNDAEALRLFLDVCQNIERGIGFDPEVFLYLCRTVQKLAVASLDLCDVSLSDAKKHSPSLLMQGDTQLGALYRKSHRTLKLMFAKLTTPVFQPESGLQLPEFMHNMTPVQLHAYMRTLAFLEDVDGMVDLLNWIFSNKRFVDEMTDHMGRRGPPMVAKTLCAFEAFAAPQLEAKLRSNLDTKMLSISENDSAWGWPSSEDIEAYIQSDKRGGSQKLQQKIIAAWWQQNPALDGLHPEENRPGETEQSQAA